MLLQGEVFKTIEKQIHEVIVSVNMKPSNFGGLCGTDAHFINRLHLCPKQPVSLFLIAIIFHTIRHQSVLF